MEMIEALVEIDRTGQAALDALWREASFIKPEMTEIGRQMQDAIELADDDMAKRERVVELLNRAAVVSGMDVFAYIVELQKLAMVREVAVREYVTARRLLGSMGAL